MPLPKIQEEAIAKLSRQPWAKPFRLVGGTALALQYEHRLSEDLDFFASEAFEAKDMMRELEDSGEFSLKRISPHTVIGEWDGAEVTFLYYQHPWLRQPARLTSCPFPLAQPLDIGLMKIEAIAQRGSRRDFIDLHFICRREAPLERLLELYPEKYGKRATPLYHILKSLCYFEDAERQPEIRTEPKVSWKAVRAFFEKEVARLAKDRLAG